MTQGYYCQEHGQCSGYANHCPICAQKNAHQQTSWGLEQQMRQLNPQIAAGMAELRAEIDKLRSEIDKLRSDQRARMRIVTEMSIQMEKLRAVAEAAEKIADKRYCIHEDLIAALKAWRGEK